MVGEHEADGEAERFSVQTSTVADAELVEKVDCCNGDVLVVDLIGALSRSGLLEALAEVARREPRTTPVRSVITHRTVDVAVELIRSKRVHATDQDRVIPCRTHCVCKCRHA